MSDYCGGCRYDPRKRLGDKACPFTAGYWAFLSTNRPRIPANARMARTMKQMERLNDLDAVVDQEKRRGSDPP
ncbi:hypothetical protein ABZ671_20590 [Micromonospora sp. NPDC006766]|uniref:hypothetical protein n=1 Tax=Micromonospora sp. NPDC006766 TaxID=3154778 RepID=UPI0033ED78C1